MTEREARAAEVRALRGRGFSRAQIAEQLGWELGTVDYYLYHFGRSTNAYQADYQSRRRADMEEARAEAEFIMPFDDESVRDFCISEASFEGRGYVTAGQVCDEFFVSPNSALRALRKLVERGTFRPEGERRARRYYFVKVEPEAKVPAASTRGSGSFDKRTQAVAGTGRAAKFADKEVEALAKDLKKKNPDISFEHGGNKVKVRRKGKVVATLPNTPSSTSPQSLKADMARAGLKV